MFLELLLCVLTVHVLYATVHTTIPLVSLEKISTLNPRFKEGCYRDLIEKTRNSSFRVSHSEFYYGTVRYRKQFCTVVKKAATQDGSSELNLGKRE